MNRMKKNGYVTTTDVDQSKIKAGLYIINREDNQRARELTYLLRSRT